MGYIYVVAAPIHFS